MEKTTTNPYYIEKKNQYNEGAQTSAQPLFEKLIWDINEVSRFTSYAKGTIYNLVSEGDIPYRKSRGKLWFIPNEILKWMKGEL